MQPKTIQHPRTFPDEPLGGWEDVLYLGFNKKTLKGQSIQEGIYHLG